MDITHPLSSSGHLVNAMVPVRKQCGSNFVCNLEEPRKSTKIKRNYHSTVVYVKGDAFVVAGSAGKRVSLFSCAKTDPWVLLVAGVQLWDRLMSWNQENIKPAMHPIRLATVLLQCKDNLNGELNQLPHWGLDMIDPYVDVVNRTLLTDQ